MGSWVSGLANVSTNRRPVRYVPPEQLKTTEEEILVFMEKEMKELQDIADAEKRRLNDDSSSLARASESSYVATLAPSEETNTPAAMQREIDRLQACLNNMRTTDLHNNGRNLASSTTSSSSDATSSLPTDSTSAARTMALNHDCKICFENKVNTVLIRCGHMGVCLDCSRQLDKCPICRSEIDQVIQIFPV